MKNNIILLLISLFFTNAYASGIQLVEPINNFNSPSFNVTFKWNKVSSQATYILQTSLDPSFNTIDNSIVTNALEYTINFTSSTTKVYWKVTTNGNNGFMSSNIYTLNFLNPSQFSSVVMWLDANSGNSILQPDSTISTWDNQANGSSDAIQANATQRPKLISNVCLLNNKNVVRFDGNDFMTISTGGNVMSAYAIFNFTGGATFPDYNALLTVNNGISFNNYLYTFIQGTAAFEANGYFKSNHYMNGVQTNNISPLSNYKLLSSFRNPLTLVPATNFVIGAEVASRFWRGDIAEIILTSSLNTNFSESDSIKEYLYNKYGPPITMKDIVSNSNFCDSIIISSQTCFSEYLWSTGETTPSIKTTPNKKYTLTTKNIFGLTSTTSFNVYPYPRLDNKTVYICQGDTFKLNLNLPTGFTALWSTGLNNTNINISTSGQYTVKITDNAGCFVFDTINVIVDKPQLLPAPDASDSLRICLNEKLFLTTTTSFDSIQWSTGSTDNFIPITAPGNYNVYGKTSAGCVINKSFHVRITGNAPAANFTFSPACDSNSTLFNDNSTTNGGNITGWSWTFGNGNTGITQNPSNTYNTVGNYNVGLKIITNQGCSDSISRVVRVNRRPKANFDNRQACERNPTLFQDFSIANSTGIADWRWDFNGLGGSGFRNPYFEFPAAATYNVKLAVTNSNGCKDSVIKPVKINQSPVANFSFDEVCGNTPVNFRFLTVVPPSLIYPDNITWNWNFGDNTSENAIKDAVHRYATPGTYDVMLAVASKDGGCPDTIVKQVKVFDYPIVDFDVSATQCAGKEIAFTDISQTPDGTPITKWRWYFSGQGTDTMQNTSYAFQTEGNYTIQLTATNAVGCTQTKMRSIAVSSLPTPQFTFSPQNGLPPLIVNYTNQSSTSGNYVWDYGDGSALVAGYNPPTHTYTTIGTYPIKLIATNFRGCTDTLTKYILVDRAFLDGIITSITITPFGDYYQIQATILNGSNVEIRSLGLNLQVGSGSVIRENWSGSLLPGETAIYNFNAEIKIGENAIPIVCASIDNVNNNSTEDRTDNNTTCKEVRVGSFDVLNVYPNPAYETINFGVMLPKDGKVSIGFVDALGRVLYKNDFDGVRGYNNLSMNTSVLNAAVYIAVVTYDGETKRVKFMRRDRK